VLAACFECGGGAQHLLTGRAVRHQHLDHSGTVAGEGAGLVEGHGMHGAKRLEGSASLDEHAVATGGADGGYHRDRHRDGKGTGGGGHEDHQGPGQPHPGITQGAAGHGDDGGEDHDARHQGASHPLGDALARRLAFLCLLHDVDDPGQGALRHHGADLDLQHPTAVDGGGEDLAVGGDLDGYRLPCHHRQVDRADPAKNDTIGGQALAGTHHQDVAHHQL
jgi:hypothetical protein